MNFGFVGRRVSLPGAALIAVLFWPQGALAYIDPGTGAMVVQTILALVAAVAFYFRNPLALWRDFKGFVKRLLTRSTDQRAAEPGNESK